jgi:DNA-binding protein YbaB
VAGDDQFGTEALDRLLADARRTLESMRSGAPEPSELSEIRGAGEAADGLVKASVVSVGQVDTIELDPRALRLGSELLAGHLRDAVNAAFADLRAKATAESDEVAVDSAGLAESLQDLQNQSVRSMAAFNDAMAGVLARLRESER